MSKFSVGDSVVVISGPDKGREGMITHVNEQALTSSYQVQYPGDETPIWHSKSTITRLGPALQSMPEAAKTPKVHQKVIRVSPGALWNFHDYVEYQLNAGWLVKYLVEHRGSDGKSVTIIYERTEEV